MRSPPNRRIDSPREGNETDRIDWIRGPDQRVVGPKCSQEFEIFRSLWLIA